tara:strand:+ start:112 stop:441 length:330 start_codon:yes stop_codon:yes gene_type:complete
MPTNRKRRSRRARTQVTPLQLAVLTGTALPEKVGPFEAYAALNPMQAGLLANESTPFADVWASYHGRSMSDADRAAIEVRRDEIESAVAATRTRQRPSIASTSIEESDR